MKYFAPLLVAWSLWSDGPASRLAVIQSAPELCLTTHDGSPYRSSEANGKVRIVSFIFTQCNGSCPATTHRMAQVQERLKNAGKSLIDAVQLVSITLDPKRDTQEVLRGYMRLYDVDSRNWTFLTGSAAEVESVLAAWEMWAKPTANGQIDHPSRIFLVDRMNRIREIYDLNYFKADWVIEDIQSLLNEK